MKSINITSEDIYKQLIAGNDREAVGAKLAEEINAILDEAFDRHDAYIADQKAKTEKHDAMKNIFKSISDYAKLNGDDSIDANLDEMSDEELKLLGTLLDAVFAASKSTPTDIPAPKKTKVKIRSDDKMIEDFLTSLFS